jgi:hypothetical protein
MFEDILSGALNRIMFEHRIGKARMDLSGQVLQEAVKRWVELYPSDFITVLKSVRLRGRESVSLAILQSF